MSDGDAARAPTPDKGGGQRSLLTLAVLFVIAFVLAVAVQVSAHRQQAVRQALSAQASAAALIAERVNANLAVAWGAASGAGEAARGNDALGDAALANAAASAQPVRAAAVFDRAGGLLAISDRAQAPLAEAARAAAAGETMWAGAPDMGGLPTAPVIVRRIGERLVVTILDASALAPDMRRGARVLVAASSGAVLYASPALQQAGADAQRLMLEATQSRNDAALASDAAGAAWAIGEARTATGGFRVIVSAPAQSPFGFWFAALARFALLASAPLAAIGVLYLLMRHNHQRARLAEQDAERAEAQFRLAADGARAGVFELRASDDQMQVNAAAMQLLGTEQDTLALEDFLKLIAPEDRFALEEELRRARQSGLLDARFRVGRGAGFAWIEARGAGVQDATGPGSARIFGTIIDVSHRHEAEARASRLERQLRAAIDSFSGPFALWDGRRRLILWNQSFAQTFDLGPELLRPRASYEAIAAASAARIKREKHDAAEPDVRVIELANGEWLHLVERRTSDGGLVTVGVDITALKRKEEELARNERRLTDALGRAEAQEYKIKALAREAHEERLKAEDASRAKSAFLANMSHELRTPLNAIIGFSEIMAKELFGQLPNDQYRQYSSDIFDSGNHLLDLINDILDMAKIEAGKVNLAPRPLDPAVAIDQAVRLTKRRADEKGLSIVVDAEELPEIEADHRAVKQMLLNLLSNAVKFTDTGAIMVHARGVAGALQLRVIDTGCGIPEEHLPRLAQPFQQVEAELSRNHSGTGLGLALTKSLVEMHGGRLSIQSEVGRGTIVTITLPSQFGGQRAPESTAAE